LTTSTTELLGLGLYSVDEAARILHANPATVRRWVEGYYHQDSEAKRQRHRPVVLPELDRFAGHRLLTFANLMELHLIKLFRDAGVHMRTIRKAAEMAARRFATDHPFAWKRFDTDGKAIFITLSHEDDREMVQDAVTAQRVFEEMVRPFFLKVDDHQNEIIRYWPLGRQECVVIDPSRAFGQPIDDPSGVPTAVLAEALEVEGNAEFVARAYRVSVDAVLCAARFEGGAAA